MQPKTEPGKPPETGQDLKEIQALTPFTGQDLRGVRFARGNMLGGASPLESASSPPWESEQPKTTETSE